MKRLRTILATATVFVIALTGSAGANVIEFQQNQDNGSGQYEWVANNWYVPPWDGGPLYRLPDANDSGRLGYGRACLIDGQTAEIGWLDTGFESSGGTLTTF